MKTDSVNQPEFEHALYDYFYLVNKNYPVKELLKLVGNRYNLSGNIRNLLFRGVTSKQHNLSRSKRLKSNLFQADLIIDAYNVLFTYMNYKMGRLVFIGTDNICRDTGSQYGRIKNQHTILEAINQLCSFLQTVNPGYISVYFDGPVSYSAVHKLYTEKKLDELELTGNVEVVKSADQTIIGKSSGIICSSDSGIIDQTVNPIADLPRLMLHYHYKPDLLDLRRMLEALEAFNS